MLFQAEDSRDSTVSSATRVLTSDSRNLRCPPGVRIDPIRPADAHRVTVFGSTLKIRATSPGVSNRSGVCMATTCLQSGARQFHVGTLAGYLRRTDVNRCSVSSEPPG